MFMDNYVGFGELESILMPQQCPSTRTSSPGLIQGLLTYQRLFWVHEAPPVSTRD